MSLKSYQIGEWTVEPSLNRISKEGNALRVEPQLMDVLNLLVSKSGEIVTKEELKDAIWSDVVVTENVFTRAISSLRKVLNDDPSNPKYIETISKTGYRLMVPVKPITTQKPIDFFIIKLPRRTTLLLIAIGTLLGLGAFVFLEAFSLNPSPLIYDPVPIANTSNTEYWPAISTDGRLVAFASNKSDNNWDIYIQSIGSETPLRLTESKSAELRPIWSADGSFVYYIRYEMGGANIYKKPIVGGNEIRVAKAPSYSRGDFDISPDGRWLLHNLREEKNLPTDIVMVSLEDGTQEILSENDAAFKGDVNPRFSPSGNQVAFIREKNPASMYLFVKDLESGELTQLTTSPQSINGFDWSKDGRHLIYGGDRSGLYKLWSVNLETKDQAVMRVGDYQMVMPRVATTGRHIYAKMKDNVNIWQYNLELQTASTWFGNNDLNLNPVASPKGDKVCFTMKKNNSYEIWVADLDGSNQIPITEFIGTYLTAPCWSMDGNHIVFQGFLDGQSDLFMVDAKGGIPKNLTTSKLDEQTPFIGNENTVYFSSNNDGLWQIERMDINGNDRQLIIESGYAPKYADNKIYFVKKDQLGIWTFNLSTSTEELLIKAFNPMNWGAFSVTDSSIYYLNAESRRIERFDLTSKQSQEIYQPLKRIARMGYTMSVSPNKKHLFFSQIDANDADIMLLEEQVN